MDEHDKQIRAKKELIRKQSRKAPVCAEAVALEASLAWEKNGAAFISTMMDYEDELEEWRPF